MAPLDVSGIAQAQPVFSGESASPLRGDNVSSDQVTAVSPPKDVVPASADTVTISSQSKQAAVVDDGKESEANKELAAKDDKTTKINSNDIATAKTVFLYDNKGDLIVKYMDSAKRLVYQDPSQLMLRMKEYAPKSDSSVDMKA